MGRTRLMTVDLAPYGFGGASVGNLYRASSDEEAHDALAASLEVGYTYWDTAPRYGHGLSEQRIGAFLQGYCGPRPALSTKVGRLLVPAGPEGPAYHGFADPLPFDQVFDYSYDGILRSFDESCARLGVEAVDVLYMHDIGRATHFEEHETQFRIAMEGGYRAMERLKAEGRVKAIGLGVNEWEVCVETFAHARFDLFMIAGRYTLLEQGALDVLMPECEARGVAIVSAGPLNSGLLARRPDATSHYDYHEVPRDILLRAQTLHDFCADHHVPLQAAALQFPLLHPSVVSVVGGMASRARVLQAADWLAVDIPASFWRELKDAGLLREDAPTEAAP